MFARAMPTLFLALTVASAAASLRWERDVQVVEAQPEAKKLTASFPFENAGPAPVTIKSIKTNCGCTAASTAKKTWQPGERGEVTVTFVIGSRHGYYETPV